MKRKQMLINENMNVEVVDFIEKVMCLLGEKDINITDFLFEKGGKYVSSRSILDQVVKNEENTSSFHKKNIESNFYTFKATPIDLDNLKSRKANLFVQTQKKELGKINSQHQVKMMEIETTLIPEKIKNSLYESCISAEKCEIDSLKEDNGFVLSNVDKSNETNLDANINEKEYKTSCNDDEQNKKNVFLKNLENFKFCKRKQKVLYSPKRSFSFNNADYSNFSCCKEIMFPIFTDKEYRLNKDNHEISKNEFSSSLEEKHFIFVEERNEKNLNEMKNQKFSNFTNKTQRIDRNLMEESNFFDGKNNDFFNISSPEGTKNCLKNLTISVDKNFSQNFLSNEISKTQNETLFDSEREKTNKSSGKGFLGKNGNNQHANFGLDENNNLKFLDGENYMRMEKLDEGNLLSIKGCRCSRKVNYYDKSGFFYEENGFRNLCHKSCMNNKRNHGTRSKTEKSHENEIKNTDTTKKHTLTTIW
ncbi:hypothetical protein EDEG_02146 [Edhazardia aedis USNM 41457]|uniref:Uncharacterized protein n=1 Tax=Edhazardia aedis (strain USNM 41457) TaxID=1003232 RepID=J9DLQ7_EDHAE|nr:hypothetical protein EDEG_02146 [Edhazardia aedis USNM 41457]|eukprot:EJW03525.1 hypothetical protein EDEG_02146 [Edhazardia aedis USNM 41457]